jgi:hypothetical protein
MMSGLSRKSVHRALHNLESAGLYAMRGSLEKRLMSLSSK